MAAATTRVAAALTGLVRDLAGIAGAAAIAYGAWLAYPPAGFIAGGTLTVAGVVLMSRAAPPDGKG